MDEKETDWIQEYDSMIRDKGYNMKEGGLGGRLGEVAKGNLSNAITEKWQEDLEYQEKQLNARKELGQNQEFLEKMTEINRARAQDPEWVKKMTGINRARAQDPEYVKKMTELNRARAQDPEWVKKMTEINREKAKNPEWLEKMTEINQEIARSPETQEKMSRAISGKWQDQKYQESVSKGVTGKWQETKYRERQFTAKREGKRQIPDKGEFLQDIQEMKKKDINDKYDMNGKCINKRIGEMLGHHGIKNYSQAKKYLEDKNLDDVLKDINERQNNQPQKFDGKKEISNKKEFLEDIQNIKSKEIEEKYDMRRTTVNKRIGEMLGEYGVKNYTEAKKYLEDKNLDEVVKGINERLNNQSQKFEGKTTISNKREFLEDIQKLQKNEIDIKYKMDPKTVNNKIKEMLGQHGVKNYTDAKKYLKDKKIEDVLKDIEDRNAEKREDNQTPSEQEDKSKENEKEDDKESREEKNEESSEESNEEPPEEKSEESSEETTEKPTEKEKEEGEERPKEQESQELQSQIGGDVSNEQGDQPEKSDEKSRTEFGFIDDDWDWGETESSFRDIEEIGPSRSFTKDNEGVGKSSLDKNIDYEGIDELSEGEDKDYKWLDEDSIEEGNDFDGIDDHSREGDKDHDDIDEDYNGVGESGGHP